MALSFDNKEYRTINDVKTSFRTSEKTIRKLIDEGHLPQPKIELYGTRSFRYFDDEWMEAAQAYFSSLKNGK